MRRLLIALGACLAVAAPAAAHDHTPKPGRPADSEAPANSAPHYIPNEPWVQYHWLPFDETRLYALLHTDREALWRWLRDDTQTLEMLGHQHGFHDAGKLAASLVATRHVSESKRHVLQARALRVLTQGHLSQHLIFHTLHQDAGPDQATAIFGVRSTKEFQRIRKLDLSPLRIGRLHGRTRAQMQHGIIAALRTVAAKGVRDGDVSARESAIFVQRQLRQVPRWLGEDHYNGPPETHMGKPIYPFRASWASPTVSADGSTVLFDAAQPAPPLAVRFGEVNLGGRRLDTGTDVDPRDASAQAILSRPCSSFDPSVSTDGSRVAFELSAGNRTFAKRYGNVLIGMGDLTTHRVWTIAGGPRAGGVVSTAYAPSLSGDGLTAAFVEVAANPMSATTAWASRVVVGSTAPGAAAPQAITTGDSYEPVLSTDGSRVAFSRLSSGRSQVFVRDLRSGQTLLAGRLPGGAPAGVEAWAPALSADGYRVAFAARDTTSDRPAVYVRDLETGVTERVGTGDEPSLSADGRIVAFSVPAATGASAAGRPLQQIRVVALGAGERTASVTAAGVPADGWSGQPVLTGDGTKVAFTTDAVALGAGGTGPGNLHVVVRDLETGTTTTANPAAPVERFDTGAGALSPGGGRLCALAPPSW